MKVGDIVILKGLDFPVKMVVASVEKGQALCVFHDNENRPQQVWYPKAILEKVK